ncbi:MAG TPA: hypothetical protein DCY07_07850 [Rhodospirillaceae bacterium]|nr:hypothetical protein [Rhodospirillaceae bacterium]
MKRFVLVLMVLGVLGGCSGGERSSGMAGKLVKQYGGEKTRPDKVAERFVVLLHPHSGEKVSLTYYEKGRYDAKAMQAVDRLFRDRNANVTGKIDPELIDCMVDIRTRLGLPPTVVFEILSGYRANGTNEQLRAAGKQAAKESLHKYGLAVDFRIKNVNGKAIAEIAKTMQRGGVSFYPSSNHVHVDIGNIRTWATR